MLQNKTKGFIALTSTIIISTVILLLLITAFVMSIIEIEKSEAKYSSEMARSWVNYCTEEALQKIRENSDYSDSEDHRSAETGDGCFFIVTGEWPEKIVQSTGQYSNYIKKIKVIVSDYSPLLEIESWKEVAEF